MSELKIASIFELEKVLKGSSNKLFYSKSEADKVIKEKDKEIARLDDLAHAHNIELLRKENLIAEVKAKLESVQATAYAESLDAGMENLKLKRAMWLARAERAHVTTLYWNVYCYQNNCLYFRDFMPENCNPFRSPPKKTAMEWSDLWESIETKCRSKAEEYKWAN